MKHKLFRLFFVLTFVIGLAMMSTPQSARAAGPWYVSTAGNDANDCLTPDTTCATINGAIGKAVSGDMIMVATGTYTGSVGIPTSLTLSGGWNAAFTAQSGMSTIDGQGLPDHYGISTSDFGPNITVSIDSFIITNATTGIYNGVRSALTVSNSTMMANGFGIHDSGPSLTLNNSIMIGNSSHGIVVDAGGNVVVVNNSVVNDNGGRGISFGGSFSPSLTINNSTISNNASGGVDIGDSVFNSTSVNINNSTIANNITDTFSFGGGILLHSSYYGIDLAINNSIVNGNSSSSGGGLYSAEASNIITLRNTILANNTATSSGPDCLGTIAISDHNIISNTSNCAVTAGTGDQFNVNPLISAYPLGTIGYFALLVGSPAIDAGDPATCLSTDQRGVTRPQGAVCDIGAYEYTTPGSAASLSVVSGSGQRAETTFAFSNPLQAAALDSQGSPVSGVTIDFTAPASGPSGIFTDTGINTTSVITDEGGVATTSTFTANDQAGAYTVSASANGLGSVNFSLEQISRPANDNFANAEPIASLPFTATVDITEATYEPNEPQYCYYMPNTVWYSFTPTENTLVRANTQGSAISSNMNVFSTGNLNFLGCTIYNGPITFLAEAGQTYYLQTGGINGEVGTVKVNLEQIPPPPNDNFANATSIGSLPSTIDFDTTAATFQSGEPSPSCAYPAPPYKTVWFAFTASQDGSISASVLNSSFSPFIAAYSGTGFNNLTQLGCGQYSNKMTFHVVSGQTYYFQVGGLYGGGGTGQLLLENAPLPRASFYYYPGDPSKFDTVQFQDNSDDPANVGIQTYEWNFGDGAVASGYSATHKFAADGEYQVTHTVTTVDGRTGSITQTVQVRSHDVAITKITTPNSANVGQTKTITVTLRNRAYPEQVQIDLYKSTANGFVWVATVTKSVRALSGNRTTAVNFSYKFLSEDAKLGKVTFRAVVTISGARDAYPSDNEAISSITKVAK